MILTPSSWNVSLVQSGSYSILYDHFLQSYYYSFGTFGGNNSKAIVIREESTFDLSSSSFTISFAARRHSDATPPTNAFSYMPSSSTDSAGGALRISLTDSKLLVGWGAAADEESEFIPDIRLNNNWVYVALQYNLGSGTLECFVNGTKAGESQTGPVLAIATMFVIYTQLAKGTRASHGF